MRMRLHYRRYRLPFRAALRTAHGLWREREGLIVRLEDTAEGREHGAAVGFGEVATLPAFGTETVDEAETILRGLGEWIEDAALAAVPPRFACVRHALANAKAPLAGVVPAATRAYLPVAALIPAGRAALMQIPPRAEIGFRTFKWKVGVGDVGDELALLDDVCAALPAGAKLRLDANGAWDRRRAERWLERCAERPVEFVEQPVAADARGAEDLLLGLAGSFPTPIGLDESLGAGGDVERWLGLGWPGVFVVKPSLLADVPATLGQLAKAKAPVVFSSALETAVGAKAALGVALAWPGEPRALGFGVWPLFAAPGFDGPAAMPFVRAEDVAHLNPEAVWSALS